MDALVSRLGGREALIRYLSVTGATPLAEPAKPEPDTGAGLDYANATGLHIALRLSPEELRRIDEESAATKYTRNRWVAALIRRALFGRSSFNRSDKIHLAKIAAELKSIDLMTQRSMKMIGRLEQAARECAGRLQKMDELRGQLKDMADSIEAAVGANDAYWDCVTDGPDTDAGRATAKADQAKD